VNLQRITRIQVLGVWVILVAAVALLSFFMLITPRRKAIGSTNDQAAAAEAEAAKKPAAERALEAAKKAEAEVNRTYQKILDTRMPKLDFSDHIPSTVRMWDFADEEQRLMDKWFASTGARVSGYGFPTWGTAMPANFPTPPNMPMLPAQNWNLTVEVKDFAALLDWLLKLPKAPRFMQMGSVTIGGPREAGQPLVAQIPVTLYEWTGVLSQTGGAAAAAAGGAGGAAGTAAAAGGRGGRMGGGGGGGMGGGRGGGRGGRGARGGM